MEGPSLSISKKFIISVTHSVVGLTADISSENTNDMGRSRDGKVLLTRKQHWFHINEETVYDQVCIYYISTACLNQREEGCFQNVGLAQFFGSTKLRYLQAKCEFLFQSRHLDVNQFESEILPLKRDGVGSCDTRWTVAMVLKMRGNRSSCTERVWYLPWW